MVERKPDRLPAIQWRTVVVRSRVLESPYSVALVLGSVDGEPLPAFSAGQFVWVGVSLPGAERHVLQYSLWTADDPGNWRITVKLVGGDRDAALAREASNFIHYHVFDGDELEVGLPSYSLSPRATAEAAAELRDIPSPGTESAKPTALWKWFRNRIAPTHPTALGKHRH
jgi:ferredoxin-NADP reductase